MNGEMKRKTATNEHWHKYNKTKCLTGWCKKLNWDINWLTITSGRGRIVLGDQPVKGE
jgi:hypothetical protein